MGIPGVGDLTFAFLGDAGVVGRIDIVDMNPEEAMECRLFIPIRGPDLIDREENGTAPTIQGTKS